MTEKTIDERNRLNDEINARIDVRFRDPRIEQRKLEEREIVERLFPNLIEGMFAYLRFHDIASVFHDGDLELDNRSSGLDPAVAVRIATERGCDGLFSGEFSRRLADSLFWNMFDIRAGVGTTRGNLARNGTQTDPSRLSEEEIQTACDRAGFPRRPGIKAGA